MYFYYKNILTAWLLAACLEVLVNGDRPRIADDVTNHPRVGLINAENCGPLNERPSGDLGRVGEALLNEYPWMALLGYKRKSTDKIVFGCTGSLISSQYVLTAAQCIPGAGQTRALTTVRLGEYDQAIDPECEQNMAAGTTCTRHKDVGIETTIVHPGFGKPFKSNNDIALIRLASHVVTESIKPICLPVGLPPDAGNQPGEILTVAGWGGPKGMGTRLGVQLVNVVPVVECANKYKNSSRYREVSIPSDGTTMCAGGHEKGPCSGDGGAPLFGIERLHHSGPRYIQFGIVNFGPTPCRTSSMPDVYIRVASYMKWILDSIRN